MPKASMDDDDDDEEEFEDEPADEYEEVVSQFPHVNMIDHI